MFKIVTPLLLCLVAANAYAASPGVLSTYRELVLGSPLQVVLEQLQVPASDVKVLYDKPSLVQEVTWKPHRFISGSTVAADPLGELILTFHLGRLERIVAIYDRERTAGLTDNDMNELFVPVYGVPLLRPTPPAADPTSLVASNQRRPITTWANDASTVVLWREEYPRRLGLTIASINDSALQLALIDGAAMMAKNAPQRERDRQTAVAADAKSRDEQIRLENKAKFKP